MRGEDGPAFSRSMPDRAPVAEFAAHGAEILGDDPAAARAPSASQHDALPPGQVLSIAPPPGRGSGMEPVTGCLPRQSARDSDVTQAF
jgi:hypothetical protein